MTPYMYASLAGSDQVYFFLHALLLCLCVSYFQRRLDRRLLLPICIAIVAAYANMVRPVGAVVFWLFILVAFVLRSPDLRRLLLASSVYMLLMAGWVVWDREYGTNGGASPGTNYPSPNNLARTAERRLAEAYFSRQGLFHAQSDAAANGYPYSSKVRVLLR